ncbi:MAG: MFS transporter [Acidimicrobiales bacterium]
MTSPSPSTSTAVTPSGRVVSTRRVLVVCLFGMAAGSFPITVLSASIPEIATDLSTTKATANWVLSAPILVFAVVTPIAGKLGDLYGHRRIYLSGYAAAVVVLALTPFARSIGELIALRTLAQAASSVTAPAAMAFIITLFEGKARSKALGYWTAVAAISPSVGVIVGGPLVDLTSWRVLFVMQTGLALLALVLAIPVLPETDRRPDIRFDIPGAVTLGLAVGSFLFGLNRIRVWGIDDPLIITCLVVAPIMAVAFVAIERRAEAPLVPLSMVRQRGFAVAIVAQALVSGAYMGGFVVTPLLLEGVFGYSTTVIAFIMLPRPFAFGAASTASGHLESRLGIRTLVMAGGTILGAALVAVAVSASAGLVVGVVLGIAFSGIGQGLTRPALVGSVGKAVDDQDLGVAGGLLQMSSQIGVAAGMTILTAIVGESESPDTFFTVFMLAAAAGFGGAVAGRFLAD